MGKVTDVMNARAAECEDMEELIDFCKEFDSEMINFSKFMNELIKRKNMTVKEFVNIYNSQKTKIPKWFDGTLSPTERHQYIKIAILMGMTPEETNLFLTRCGGYSKLNPKNIDDAACIHALTHHMDYEGYKILRNRMENELKEIIYRETREIYPEEYVAIRDSIPHDDGYFDTVDKLDEQFKAKERKNGKKHKGEKTVTDAEKKQEKYLRLKLMNKESEFTGTEVIMDHLNDSNDMIQYVKDNWKAIVTANLRLVDYIDSWLESHPYVNEDDRVVDTIGGFLFEKTVYDDISFNTYKVIQSFVSEIRCHFTKLLSRDYLIFLGVLFDFDIEEINTMLSIAHMDFLCARVESEAALIAALHNCRKENKISDVKEFLADEQAANSKKIKKIIDLLFTDKDFMEFGLSK